MTVGSGLSVIYVCFCFSLLQPLNLAKTTYPYLFLQPLICYITWVREIAWQKQLPGSKLVEVWIMIFIYYMKFGTLNFFYNR